MTCGNTLLIFNVGKDTFSGLSSYYGLFIRRLVNGGERKLWTSKNIIVTQTGRPHSRFVFFPMPQINEGDNRQFE